MTGCGNIFPVRLCFTHDLSCSSGLQYFNNFNIVYAQLFFTTRKKFRKFSEKFTSYFSKRKPSNRTELFSYLTTTKLLHNKNYYTEICGCMKKDRWIRGIQWLDNKKTSKTVFKGRRLFNVNITVTPWRSSG